MLSAFERDLLTRTVIGEAANEPLEGQAGVAAVALNRLKSGRYGKDLQDVLFAKHQFEPWNTRRSELLGLSNETPAYQRAAAVVDAIADGRIADPTGGATHFLNKDVVIDRGDAIPKWAKGEGQQIGRHTFLAPEGRVESKPVQVAQVEEVTDPAILEALGVPQVQTDAPSLGVPEAAIPDMGGVEEVTDPAILRQLGVGAEAVDENTPIQTGKEVGLKEAFTTGLASNPDEAVRFLASKLYPDEPLEQAVTRFGSRDGTLYHRADDGKLYQALPDGVAGQIAESIGGWAPMVAGATAGMIAAPAALTGVGLPLGMAAAGGTAAAVEAGRQALGDYMMGDAADNDISEMSVLREGAMEGLGQGIGAGIAGLTTRSVVRDISRLDPRQTADAYRQAQQVGVDITPAEATGLPTLAAQQKRLTNITPTADQMREFLTRRDGQVVKAWGGFLDDISQAADAEDVGRMARDASEGALAGMRAELQAMARPLYEAAYSKPSPTSPVLSDLLGRPVMKAAVAKAQTLAKNEGAAFDPANPSMLGWDYIKRGLDDILGSKEVLNEKTGGFNNYGRIVTNIKNQMLKELDAAVPEYAQARRVYSTGVDDIADAMGSVLKIVADTKDQNMVRAARQIFDPRTRSPQMVAKLRHAIEAKDPQAWQAVKRMYMQDVTIDALRRAETGDIVNPAGKIHKAFMDERVQQNLRAAMSDDEWNQMKNLLVVFRRAASVPTLRSDTAFNQEALREAERQARPLLARIAGIPKAMNPAGNNFLGLDALQEWATNRNLERHAEQVVDLVTSGDPQTINAMKELRRLSPMDKRWLALFGHLISRGSAFGAGQLVPDADYAPGEQTGN